MNFSSHALAFCDVSKARCCLGAGRALLPAVAEGHRGARYCPGLRDNRIVPMEVAQELAAGRAALAWKAGQYGPAQAGWACPLEEKFSIRLTTLDVCPWQAALSHGAQAFSFALLRGIKAVHTISSWHPTYRLWYFVLWILSAGLRLTTLVICGKADLGRSFPQLLAAALLPSPTPKRAFCPLLLLPYLSSPSACPAAGLYGRRQTHDGTFLCSCKWQSGFFFTPSAKIHLLASLYGLKSSAGIGPASITALSPWAGQGALPLYICQSLGIDIVFKLWLSSHTKITCVKMQCREC